MAGVDITSIPIPLLHTPLDEIFSSPEELTFDEILNYLSKNFPADTYEQYPIYSPEVSEEGDKAFSECSEQIVEIYGGKGLGSKDTIFGASFLAGSEPKAYIENYIKLTNNCDVLLNIWIDDVIGALKHKRTIFSDVQKNINNSYQEYFSNKEGISNISFSTSNFHQPYISDEYVRRYKNISMNDFMNLLPYHQRSLSYINLFDIIHLLWNGVVLSHLKADYHVTSINTKQQVLFLYKTLGTKRRIIFVEKS